MKPPRTWRHGIRCAFAVVLLLARLNSGFSRELDDAGFPLIKTYASRDGGTDSPIQGMLQHPDGRLNFASDGLLEFDGERWTRTPLSGTYGIISMDRGDDGRIWIGAMNEFGWFERNQAGAPVFHSLRDQLPPGARDVGLVWHVFATPRGAVFVSRDKVFRWNGSKFDTWTIPSSTRLTGIRSGGLIYFHSRTSGLFALRDAGPELLISAAALGNKGVMWLERQGEGYLFATSNGLFRYDDGRLQPWAPSVAELVTKGILSCATRLPDGRLALGTLQNGIIFVRPDGTLDRILTDQEGLPSRSIVSLFVDREHSLWAGSISGVFRISVESMTTVLDQRNGLPQSGLFSFIPGAGVSLGVSGNGLFASEAGGSRFHRIESDYSMVVDLAPTPDGILLADFLGIRLLKDGKTTLVCPTQTQPQSITPSRHHPGSWLVVLRGSVLLLDSHWRSRTLVHLLPDDPISLEEDDQGGLWISSFSRGCFVAYPHGTDPVEAKPVGPEQGLPEKYGAARIRRAPGGQMLILSNVGGWIKGPHANRFSPIKNYPAREAVIGPGKFVGDKLWLAQVPGKFPTPAIGCITVDGENAVWRPHSVEGLDTLKRVYFVLAEPGPNESTVLWIGSPNGMLRTVVPHGPVAPNPQAPLLNVLAQFGDSDDRRPIIQALPYSTRSINFEFAEPAYGLRPQLRLETKLDGVDHDWMPADASSRRELNALRDGRYTFHVRAVAETGLTSDEATFGFVINPPWWRTNAALAGGLFTLSAGVYGVFHWRISRLRRHNAQLEAKVAERTTQLTQASAAKSQFLANMSHDIRNPLNGIVGLALALEDTKLDAKQGELVATLRECTAYLSTLVDDVLDFASIEAGRFELRPAPFSPAEILRTIVTTMKPEADSGSATLLVDVDPLLLPTYIGDAGRIQQILVNYVTNALKYAGGRITVAAAFCPETPDEVEFSVSDEGPGISAADQQRIFQKFTRLTNRHSAEITGTGLGLASCRLLADHMGGSVGVESAEGKGARFFLRLPLAPSTGSPAEYESPTATAQSVLLVEDTNYNALAARAVLGRLGLDCERASSGAEAIRMFGLHRYQVVLLDRNLPDMDGTEVARQIRALEQDGRRALLLAVTAYCTTEDRAQCLAAGMDAFVGKPLTPEKLRRVLTDSNRRQLAASSVQVARPLAPGEVDLSLLQYISDGTGTGLGQQIELFVAALDEAERQLAAAGRGQFLQLANAAHAVLSHARLVNSAELVRAAVALGDSARASEPNSFGEALATLRQQIKQLRQTMNRHLATVRPA